MKQLKISDTYMPQTVPNKSVNSLTFRELNDPTGRTSWKNPRRFKTVIQLSDLAVDEPIITGRILSPLEGEGTYFGFKVLKSGDLRAVYNKGLGEILSQEIARLNTVDSYTVEAVSNVVTGELFFYLDDTLVHIFTQNTNTWSDVLSNTFWMISQYINYGPVKFRQDKDQLMPMVA